MPDRPPSRLALAGFLAIIAATVSGAAVRADETPELCGRLNEYEGLTVLELWGTPEQAGYAHGYLLAERILRLLDDYVLSDALMPNRQVYETLVIRGVHRWFDWPEPGERELRALLRGMQDRLGPDGMHSRKLQRQVAIDDLMAANTLADWFCMLCSSFSVWGSLTRDGQTITARNLDYHSAGGMAEAQLVVIYRGAGGTHSWVGVTWPGMVGVFTAMNDAGVTVLMHDARGLPNSQSSGFTPRALILRQALEAAGVESYVADVQRVFQQCHVMVGNNIHVSGPQQAGQPPAAVFEYDGNRRDGGVSVRLAEHNEAGFANALWCTNHMCLRKEPVDSDRFERLSRRLSELARERATLDLTAALKLIREVRQRSTLHSVVFEPARRRMHVHIPAVLDRAVEIRLDEWLSRPIGKTPATAKPDSSPTVREKP